jgi:hypothetical protein
MNLMHDRNLQYLLMLGFIVKKDFFYYIPSFTSTTAILAQTLLLQNHLVSTNFCSNNENLIITSLHVCFFEQNLQ